MDAKSTILNSVAARVTTDDGDYVAMATVVSPEFAITADHAIPDASQGYTLELEGPSGRFTVPATVKGRDERFDFAVLRLQRPVDKWVALPSEVRPDADYWKSFYDWQSFYKGPDAPEGKFLHGTIGEQVPTDARDYLSLIPATHFGSVTGVIGAPVVSEERLIGIMAANPQEVDAFYAVPITEMIKSSLWNVISEATGQTTITSREFDEVTFFKHLSKQALIALERANAIRLELTPSDHLHMEYLLAGLFNDTNGTPRKALLKVGIDELKLTSILKDVASKDIALDREYQIQPLRALPPVSGHVRQAFVAANDAAKNDDPIRMGHLLFGALSVTDCDLTKALRSFGLNKNDVPLTDTPDEITKARTKRRYENAGISSDGIDGPDLLDIEQEVEALCMVLAAKDVEPPISLGLFGDWGSGKSFFMRKMEKRFDELKVVAKREDSDYCSNIVQLWFNAWHYMDTNLWASLAAEIFDGLAEYVSKEQALLKGQKEPDYERAQLLAQTVAADAKVTKAKLERKRLEDQLRANRTELDRVRSGEDDSGLGWREAYEFTVQQSPVTERVKKTEKELDDRIQNAAQTLNIPADRDTVQKQILELHGLWGKLRAIYMAIRNRKNLRRWLVRLAIVLVVVMLVVLILPQLVALPWINFSRVVTVVVASLSAIYPLIKQAHKALDIINAAIQADREARLAKEEALWEDQKELQSQADKVQEDLTKAEDDAAKLKKGLQSLQPDQQVLDFIKQRHQSTDYTRYLGVIARARNDFEQLSYLLEKERKRETNKATGPNGGSPSQQQQAANVAAVAEKQIQLLLPRIDRIILYIDDLDRCPENKVVDVLQAVHLLLAFPLFIVVVGVDSRWLLHSLRQHAEVFRNQDEDLSQEERTHWQSTPLNYLEKIFQVPFTLWPMEKSGFARMIDSLTTSKVVTTQAPTQAQPSENQTAEQPASKEIRMAVGIGGQSPTSQTSQPAQGAGEGVSKATAPDYTQSAKRTSDTREKAAETPTKGIDPHPAHLQLTKWEIEFMKELHCLIPSPRAAKRFVNVYRLIRASVDIDDELQLKEFVGDKYQGQYRAVLILLAILTGYPDQATEILRELIDKKHAENWLEFIESFRQRDPEPKVALQVEDVSARTSKTPLAGSATHRSMAGSKPEITGNGSPHQNGKSHPGMTAAEAEQWEDLIEKLRKLRPLIQSESCAHFTRWAPKVARYSFQSGRVLLMHKADIESS